MSFRIERSATFMQDNKALLQKIARYDALFTAFDIQHATNTEYLDFPVFVFNLTLTLTFWSLFLTSLHVPLAKLFLARNRIQLSCLTMKILPFLLKQPRSKFKVNGQR
jgi:hypothetical protein